MCGICGKINLNNKPVEAALPRRMTACLSHRGPDDEGFYVKNNIGLGHRRLSIIDLSPLAHQPMSNEDGTVWIVYNGEIYNFPELSQRRRFKLKFNSIFLNYQKKQRNCRSQE